MNATGPLSFDALINDVNFGSTLDQMQRRVLGFSNTVVRETNTIDAQFRRLGQLAAGYFSFQALSQLPEQILKVRGEFQQLEIAFTTMLRSKTKADAFLREGVDFAAQSPFGLKEVANAQKQLLAYGFAAQDVIPALKRLGDISAGLGLPLERLTYLYGTTKTQGRLFAQDLNQFVGSGIPLISQLAKQFGVAEDQVKKLVEEGKVGFPEVKKAIEGLTSGEGIFTGTLDAQSKSILGLKERLSDAYDAVLNDIGKKNQGLIADTINTATGIVTHYQDVIDILKIVAVTYGTYRAALILTSIAQRAYLVVIETAAVQQSLAALAGEVLTAAQLRQATAATLLSRAQAALNATLLANPYVLVATAIAALVTAYFVFREEVQQIKTAQELMAESGKQVAGKFREQGAEVKTLISIIQNQNVAESERLKAYEKLKSIAPDIISGLDFQRAKTADLTKGLKLYLVELEKKIRLEANQGSLKTSIEQDIEAADRLRKAQDKVVEQTKLLQSPQLKTGPGAIGAFQELANYQKALEEASKNKKKTERAVAEITGSFSAVYGFEEKESVNAEISRLELVKSTITDKLSPSYKFVEDQLKEQLRLRDALTKAEAGGQKVTAKTVDYYDQEIKKVKELQAQSTSRDQFSGYQKQIDALTKSRNRLTGEMTAAEKKAVKDADKVGPLGSLSYYEAVSKKAQEVIDKTASTDTGKLAQQNAIKLDADRKAEAIRKSLAVKSFDEELADKKAKYELYQKFVTAYGQSAADAQFILLRQSGASYVDYLNAQIAKLEETKGKTGLTGDQAGNLTSLIDQRNEATGKKQAIEVFREGLQKAGQEAQSLTDYLTVLKQTQAGLNESDNSQLGIQKRLEVAEQINAVEADRKNQLAQFLAAVEGSEEQRLAITKKYGDLRSALEKQYADKAKDATYLKANVDISRAEQGELDAFNKQQADASQAFKDLNKVIDVEGRQALKIRLDRLKAYLSELERTVGKESEVYKAAAKEVKDASIGLNAKDIGTMKTFAGLAGELGDALAEVNGGLGETGRLLSGIASQANLVATAFDESASKEDKIAAGVQGVIGLVSILTSSAAQRKAKEEEYYRSMIAQQQAYNLALNDQIGLQTELSENVFVKNFEGRLRDGIAKLSAANKGYQDALKKLAEGRAKNGQGDVIDVSKIGSGIGYGAATGAAIGSIVPVIGTAVGALVGGLVGGIVGLFGGKKKEDEFGALLGTYPALIKKSADGVDELNVELAKTLVAQNLVDDNTKLLLQDTIDWTEQIKAAKDQIKAVISELAGSLGSELRDSLVGAFEDGSDAAQAFGDSVSKVLENVLSQLIFQQVFSKQFDELQKQMEASFGPGGDGSWIDDFGRFFGKADELTKLFNDGLTSAQDAAKAYGLDIFAKKTTTATANTALSGSIKSVSEETASVLAGQMNAIRIQQAETGTVIRQQLLVLSGIELNTGTSNKWLESIDRKLDKLDSDPLRAKGLTG